MGEKWQYQRIIFIFLELLFTIYQDLIIYIKIIRNIKNYFHISILFQLKIMKMYK